MKLAMLIELWECQISLISYLTYVPGNHVQSEGMPSTLRLKSALHKACRPLRDAGSRNVS